MAWSTPRTWVTDEIVTAAKFNASIRNNFARLAPATAAAAGDLIYADGYRSMGGRLPIATSGSHLVSDGSGPVWRRGDYDYNGQWDTATRNVWGSLYSITGGTITETYVTVTTGPAALVTILCTLSNATANESTHLSYAVSGATTIEASDLHSVFYESSNTADRMRAGGAFLRDDLTPGSNTFTVYGKVSAGTGTFSYPAISVLPL